MLTVRAPTGHVHDAPRPGEGTSPVVGTRITSGESRPASAVTSLSARGATLVFTASCGGLDTGPHGRAHGKRLRRELVAVAARGLRHAARLVLRVAPEHRSGGFAAARASFVGP